MSPEKLTVLMVTVWTRVIRGSEASPQDGDGHSKEDASMHQTETEPDMILFEHTTF
jgi:hypothetical protein